MAAGVAPLGWALARHRRRCAGGWLALLRPAGVARANGLVSPYAAFRARARFGTASPPLAARHLPCCAPRPPSRTGRRSAPLRLRRFASLRSARPRGRRSDGAVASPRPRACLSAFGGLRSGWSARAPVGAPARAVRPLRVRALSALRAPFARVLRFAPSARALWNSSTTTRGFGRAVRPLSGLRLRAFGAACPSKAVALARPSPRWRAPSVRFGCLVSLAFACSVWRVCRAGVSGGAVERRFAPNRHPPPPDLHASVSLPLLYPYFTLTLSESYPNLYRNSVQVVIFGTLTKTYTTMAKYLAGGRVRGTLHGVTYQRNMYTGWVAKEKSTLTKEQIETSPAFARTRENNNEMKGVGAYVKELRRSLDLFLPFVSDPIVTGRLIRELKKVQIATPGQRGFRPLVGTTIANLLVRDGFEVSEPYPLSQAARGVSIEIGARETAGNVTNQTMTISAGTLTFPAGTNACLPIVTIIECDELEYSDGVWSFMNPVEGRNIKRSVLYDKMVFSAMPTSADNFSVAYGNTTTSYQSIIVAQTLGVLSIFETKFPLPPYEFGRNLVWFGLQFGQLVQRAGGSADAPVFEFMPMRGATAGKAIATLDPIQP